MVGGILRRVLVATLIAAAIAGTVGAATASASPIDDAKATATAFLTAFAAGDGRTACSLLTPDALTRFGGSSQCVSTFSGDSGSRDNDAFATLAVAYLAARELASEHGGLFVTKSFSARALARAIGQLAPSLDVRVGKGPSAAKGQPVSTVILDSRTTGRRAIFYAESDSGDIVRLVGTPRGDVDAEAVAKGIPQAGVPAAPAPAFTFTVGDALAAHDGTILVDALLSDPMPDPAHPSPPIDLLLRLAPVGSRYLVSDLYVSLSSVNGA